MRIFRELSDFDADLAGAAVALGNFDGVHLGHRHIFRVAQETGLAVGAVTFAPHPRRFFDPDGDPFEIGSSDDKLEQLAAIGCHFAVVIDFGRAIAEMSAGLFMRDILSRALRVRHVVVGRGFVFGAERGGDVDLLRREGPSLGFTTDAITRTMIGSQICSSSMIRSHIGAGRIEEANMALGRPWRIEARLGDGSSHSLFRDVTIREGQLLPPDGQFVVDVERPDRSVTKTIAILATETTGRMLVLKEPAGMASGSRIWLRFLCAYAAADPLARLHAAHMPQMPTRHPVNITGESL
ncbi:FAD synthetase family protein [Novosphingobium terrae]|uniref:FAD synthetase family protein n=1 Tax=Novosphingobium terrae TaxID=2726189 RepID=UPI00197E9723|nr:FAD synthetase family protein [Novosphingobium terrae]